MWVVLGKAILGWVVPVEMAEMVSQVMAAVVGADLLGDPDRLSSCQAMAAAVGELVVVPEQAVKEAAQVVQVLVLF